MDEQRDTLGMPDIMEEYPVPGPRTLDGVLGFRVLVLAKAPLEGRRFTQTASVRDSELCTVAPTRHLPRCSPPRRPCTTYGQMACPLWAARTTRVSCVRSPPERSTPARTPDTADARCGSGTLISPTTKVVSARHRA